MKTILVLCTIAASMSFVFKDDIRKAVADSGLDTEFAMKSEIVRDCMTDDTKNDDIFACVQGK